MGVTDLWKLIDDAEAYGHAKLPALSAASFNRPSKGFRLGIDATAWYYHLQKFESSDTDSPPVMGENAKLRTFFFRLCRLLRFGTLPVLVFDGQDKLAWKGKSVPEHAIATSSPEKRPQSSRHIPGTTTRKMIQLMDLLGVPWLEACGDGEADLVEMEARGLVDGILSDDVDTLLFGAKLVLRHNSKTLSGNRSHRNSADEDSFACSHRTYTADDVALKTGFTREDFILIVLLQGGDYAGKGISGIGSATAYALAQCSFRPASDPASGQEPRFGRVLVERVKTLRDRPAELEMFLQEWKELLAQELETNSQQRLGSKHPSMARTLRLDDSWPSLAAIDAYVTPPVSDDFPALSWNRDADVAGLVKFMQAEFQWGNKEVQKRFRNLLGLAFVWREIRQAAIAVETGQPRRPNMSSLPHIGGDDTLVLGICSRKTQKNTFGIDSFKVELKAHVLMAKTNQALPEVDPYPKMLDEEFCDSVQQEKPVREPVAKDYEVWIPAAVVREHPILADMADNWESEQAGAAASRSPAKRKSTTTSGTPTRRRRVAVNPLSSPSTPSKLKQTTLEQSSGTHHLLEIIDSQEKHEQQEGERTRRARVATQNPSSRFISIHSSPSKLRPSDPGVIGIAKEVQKLLGRWEKDWTRRAPAEGGVLELSDTDDGSDDLVGNAAHGETSRGVRLESPSPTSLQSTSQVARRSRKGSRPPPHKAKALTQSALTGRARTLDRWLGTDTDIQFTSTKPGLGPTQDKMARKEQGRVKQSNVIVLSDSD